LRLRAQQVQQFCNSPGLAFSYSASVNYRDAAHYNRPKQALAMLVDFTDFIFMYECVYSVKDFTSLTALVSWSQVLVAFFPTLGEFFGSSTRKIQNRRK